MKQLFFLILLFCVNVSVAQYREWHVVPYPTQNQNETLTTGNGSETSPWALQYALNNPNGIIQPGDTVWLHGGIYLGRFISSLSGSLTRYITVSSYPGEWAIIDGNTTAIEYVPETRVPYTPCNSSNSLREEQEVDANPEFENTPEPLINGESDEDGNDILTVNGGFVIYRDFEVTCLGEINRILDLCNPNPGFEKMHGIEHNPNNINPQNSKCKFVNLIVRNVPGAGIGSWKYSADTEVYGCLIYNNGYILYNNKVNGNCLNEFSVLGKGPGIYSQNATDFTRKIKNNIISNNYDSGIFVFSATTNPTFDYIKNYDINDNVMLNNGNPGRRFNVNLISNTVTGTGGDSKPNLVVDSYSANSFNHPTNINVYDNIFYINSRSSFISGVRVSNSNNVSINNNYFFKGTTFGSFSNSNVDLNVKNNFYLGKRIQVYTSPTNYGNNNWDFNNNTWYSAVGLNAYPNCYLDNLGVSRTLMQFSTDYPAESDQLSNSYKALTSIAFGKNCLKTYNTNDSPIFSVLDKIIQNEYNTNKFYVTMNNPTLVSNRNVLFNNFNIPNNKYYVIRDPQNYFQVIASGSYDSSIGINLPLNLTSYERPIGYAEHCTEHSYAEVSTFIVEFGCRDLAYDRKLENLTISNFRAYEAKNNITIGDNFIADVNSEVTAKANKTIKVISESHFKLGSEVLLKIEDVCPDISYLSQNNQSRLISESKIITNEKGIIEKNDLFVISPNPNNGIFNIKSSKDFKIKKVIIQDINSAKIIFEKIYNDFSNIDVDISYSQMGLYTVTVYFDEKTSQVKTVIKR